MRLTDAGQLAELLGLDFSDEQRAAICAPLEPAVIIAGAGTGKTTVMAARVVWLVGSGQVRPDQVLGLTFTRKAAAELSARVAGALIAAGVTSRSDPDETGQQSVMTYDSFASRLVSDHGMRIGVETDPTMITGAQRLRSHFALPRQRLLYAVGAFFLSHLLYTIYFASQMTLSFFWPLPLVLLVIGALLIAVIWSRLEEMRLPICTVFVIVLLPFV